MTDDPCLLPAVAALSQGWSVFPLAPGGKLPAIRAAHPDGDPQRGVCRGECEQLGHGLWDATIDQDTVRRWARIMPRCNWGVPTEAARLVVVDVDAGKGSPPAAVLPDQGERETPAGIHDGDDVMTWAAELCGEHWPPDTHTVRTPSGGAHYYFTAPRGLEVRSSASRLGWSIDVRAAGGYVVAAGCTTTAGAWTLENTSPVAPLPSWLLLRLIRTGHCPTLLPTRPPAASPPPAAAPGPPLSTPTWRHRGDRHQAYVEAAVRGELESVASAVEGTRNDQLNRSAFSVGQLIDPYGLDLRTVADALLSAGLAAGLAESEARAAIRSGLHAGRRTPRPTPGDAA